MTPRCVKASGAPQGRVIGAISPGRHCIVLLLAGFAERHPEIVVDVHLTDAIVDVVAGTSPAPVDLHDQSCLNFSFRRLEPVWSFREDGVDYALKINGVMEANIPPTTEIGCCGSSRRQIASGQIGPVKRRATE